MKICWSWVLALVVASGVEAQTANEMLRPEHALFRVFPEARSYRAIVRDVGPEARAKVERCLPFKVHFNELGAHTLYVAFRGRRPCGLMYLRSEASQWGFSDIGWGLTTDLRIVDFWFQRGRSRQQVQLQASLLAKTIKGRDIDEVGSLLGELVVGRGTELVPVGAEKLAVTVLRSAMKAQAVIGSTWQTEVSRLRDHAMGYEEFPTAERFLRQVVEFDPDDESVDRLSSVNVMRALGKSSAKLGVVVRTRGVYAGREIVLRWVLTPELRVIRLVVPRTESDLDLRKACAELEGRILLELPVREHPVEAMGRELGAILVKLEGVGASR